MSPGTLIAVFAASNRSSDGDNDPAQPSGGGNNCTYVWVGTNLRWDLAVDGNEPQAVLGLAKDGPTTAVVYEYPPRSSGLTRSWRCSRRSRAAPRRRGHRECVHHCRMVTRAGPMAVAKDSAALRTASRRRELPTGPVALAVVAGGCGRRVFFMMVLRDGRVSAGVAGPGVDVDSCSRGPGLSQIAGTTGTRTATLQVTATRARVSVSYTRAGRAGGAWLRGRRWTSRRANRGPAMSNAVVPAQRSA